MMKNMSMSVRTSPRATGRRARTGTYVNVAGTTIRYLEAGREHPGPTLVLFHGYKAGADYWFPHMFPAMASNFHVIAPDLPGFAYSSRMTSHNLDAYAVKMNEFFDALGLQEIYLMGHSMGGQVAIATAAYNPDRVKKLVLVDSSGLPRTGPVWRVPFEMLTDASARHWGLAPLMIRLNFLCTAAAEGLTMLRHEHVTGYLKSLDMPTLIVWGSRDRVIPLEHGALLARHITHGRLAVIRGAGHMPFYQKPSEFNKLVTHFLEQPPDEDQATTIPENPVPEG